METIVSGIRPTGNLHLGNYFGAVSNFLKMQRENNCFLLHVVLDESTALTAEYRWLHISNAGIELPNYGTNTMMFLIGLTWFY